METNNVRSVLLRALFEPDFNAQLEGDPEKALKDYNLSDKERAVLLKPTSELYRYIRPDILKGFATPFANDPPPTTTVVAVVIVVAIVVFVAAVGPAANVIQGDMQRYQPLLSAIKTSSGQQRYDLIKTLVNELTTKP